MPRRNWVPWAAAGSTLLLLAGSALQAQIKPGDVGFPYGDLKEVTLRGKLVALGDELSRKYGAKAAGGGTEKQWGLALPEGQYYTFLDNRGYRELTAGEPAGKTVEVRARLFPRSMLLEVVAFKPTDAEALQRRYHCRVCNIDAKDFGPCACCGKELELVPPGK